MLRAELNELANKWTIHILNVRQEVERPWHTIVAVKGKVENIIGFKDEVTKQWPPGQIVTVAA